MKYEHILKFVCGDVWLIAPRKMETLMSVLCEYDLDVLAALPREEREPSQPQGKGIAIIPIYGTISPKMNLMTAISGGTTAEQIERMTLEAARDDRISTIIYDIDSPGGYVQGIEEAASAIQEASRSKRTVAVANHDACSAAYWLMTAATRRVASPSAGVGSVGVLAVHEWVDESASEVKHEILSIGDRKVDGHPYGPLTDDSRASMMTHMQDVYDKFVDTVAANMGKTSKEVTETFGKGAVVSASKAAELGMVDDIKPMRSVLAEEITRLERQSKRNRIDSILNAS